ncbi:MAG: hypothetical protein ABSF22_10700 [Bryobacteraceae bacterium]
MASRQAGLRLDLPNEARGLESEILRRIASRDDGERMPPPGSGNPRFATPNSLSLKCLSPRIPRSWRSDLHRSARRSSQRRN